MKYPDVESSILELKRDLPKNDQIVKTIIGFSNQNGGKLIVGVADDGTIVGVPEKEAASAIEYLNHFIYTASTPPILPGVYTQTIEGKTLLIIEVSSGANKPYFRKQEGLEKGTYIRLGRSTVRATMDLIEELKWQSYGKFFDCMPIYRTNEDDLDYKKIEAFLEKRKDRDLRKITKDTLLSYYLITQEHMHVYATTAGILLFGKRPQHFFSEAMIICSHFKGVEGRDAIASVDCTGSLFEQFDTAYEFILSRLSKSFVIKGPRREEKLEIPSEAIREALLNLIVHRNYHYSSPSKIAIYRDRIEFFSPGLFSNPTIINNLQSGFSYIRNIAICKVFREADYIEKIGSGLITIFKSYKKWGLKTPSVIEGESFVKCILPRIEAEAEEFDELRSIMDLFETMDAINISDVMSRLRLTRPTAGRKLNALVKKGFIQKKGKGRGSVYVRCLGSKVY
jgi:ATP-dependent DNA helicase RecG